jgi:hypothetical protein
MKYTRLGDGVRRAARTITRTALKRTQSLFLCCTFLSYLCLPALQAQNYHPPSPCNSAWIIGGTLLGIGAAIMALIRL